MANRKHRRMRKPTFAFACSLIAVLAASTVAYGGEPLEVVKSAAEKAIQILQDPGLQGKDKKNEKLSNLRAVVNPVFDYSEMARRTLGPHWSSRTAAEQEEFTRLFREFVERIYSDKIDLYNGEKVIFGRESIDRELAQVESFVIDAKGEKTVVLYRLFKNQSGWKVYDAVVEDIGLVANYRSQFDRIIRNSSYQELIRRLKEKK